MDKAELSDRTRRFGVRVFKLSEKLPRTIGSIVVVKQLLRAAASVASNYRAVNRAKSSADFCFKLKVVLEESDECNFWLTFLADIGAIGKDNVELNFLLTESDEFCAIFTAAINTTSLNRH